MRNGIESILGILYKREQGLRRLENVRFLVVRSWELGQSKGKLGSI